METEKTFINVDEIEEEIKREQKQKLIHNKILLNLVKSG